MKSIGYVIVVILCGSVLFACSATEEGQSPPSEAATSGPDMMLTTHMMGAADAPIDLVVYEDLSCPFVWEMFPTLSSFMQDHRNDVRLTFRHFPLEDNSISLVPAQAIECAGKLGGDQAFWGMRNQILSAGGSEACGPASYEQMAANTGIDPAAHCDCMTKETYKQPIEKAKQVAKDEGIRGTPTLIMKGTIIARKVSKPELESYYEWAMRTLR